MDAVAPKQLQDCKFRRQFGIGDYIVDFYAPEVMLGIELDGESHFTEGAAKRDESRQAFIESFGIRLVRFLNADVFGNMDGVLQVLVGEINLRRKNPPRPPLRKGGRNAGGRQGVPFTERDA